MIIMFVVTLLLGVPIAYVLGLVGAAGLITMGPNYFPARINIGIAIRL